MGHIVRFYGVSSFIDELSERFLGRKQGPVIRVELLSKTVKAEIGENRTAPMQQHFLIMSWFPMENEIHRLTLQIGQNFSVELNEALKQKHLDYVETAKKQVEEANGIPNVTWKPGVFTLPEEKELIS